MMKLIIKFSVDETNKKYIIIEFNNDEKIKLNINNESLNEIDKLSDFILENIIDNEIEFKIENTIEEEDLKNIQYLVMENFVKLFEKEYNEIKEDLKNF